MRIIDDTSHAVDLITMLTLLTVGTRIRIRHDSTPDIYMHTVRDARSTLHFCYKCKKRFHHLLRVREITPFSSDLGCGLELWCE